MSLPSSNDLPSSPPHEVEAPVSGDARSAPAGESVVIPHRWRKLSAVAAPLWAENNEGSILSTLAPVIIAALALPVSALGLLVSVSKAISIVFGPVWAWIARGTSRKGALVASTIAVAVTTAATGLSQNYGQLIALWSLAAVFIAAGLPIVSEVTSDLFDERSRGRANGNTWGVISLVGSLVGPLIGQLSRVDQGWRLGFFAAGAVDVLVAVWLVVGFQDPGIGASEPSLRGVSAALRAEQAKLTWAKVRTLARIPTFTLMLGQRLLSGHLLIGTFGILFLVKTYGFTTAVAAVVTLPFGIGYLLGTFGGGLATDALHGRRPGSGRVLVLQVAQFGFAAVAIVGTQVHWGSIGVFAAFWALMGFMQGVNPGVNRPIVMAVVPPELRGAAFALMLSVFEALAYVVYNLSAGYLSDAFGLKNVILWIPGILMVVNGVYCTLLYRTYPKDVAALEALLASRHVPEVREPAR